MKKTIITSLIGLAFVTTPTYSAENIALDDVVVTASRIEQPIASVIGDITVINQEEIERAGTSSLTNLLSRQPGVQISTNGGAGNASSVFLRGTNSGHVIVLVDGLRINSVTLGTTSFENIPLSQIEKIEILRGPASSLYGADAIGGVIQIFTKKGSAGEPQFHAAVGLGSFDTKTAEAGINGNYNDLRYGLNVSSFDTKGFSAIHQHGGDFDNDKDGYNNLSVSAFLELTLMPGHSWGLQFFESKGHNNFDSGSGNFDNYGNQTLQSYAFTSKNQFTDYWHSTFTLGLGEDDSDSHSLPSPFFGPADGVSKYRTQQKQITWQNDFSLPLGSLTLAYDRLEQKIKSTDAYDKTKRSDDGFLASYLLNKGSHSVSTSLREDHNSQFGNFTTGGIGYAYQITPAWRVSTSYGKAFKAPSFNDLYYPGFGTSNLKPEKSENVDIAIKYQTNRFNASVTIFENHIRDLIAFAGPVSAACTFGGCPVNINKAEIEGVIFDGSWDITDNLLLSGNFTVQSPRDEETDQLLIRRGNRYGTVNLLHSYGDFQWGAEVSGASTRYDDAGNTEKMSGYMLVNLTANYQLNPEWKLEARANNILDKEYVLAINFNDIPYNTAGSNLFVGLRYDMKP